jgi:hypothetical protein
MAFAAALAACSARSAAFLRVRSVAHVHQQAGQGETTSVKNTTNRVTEPRSAPPVKPRRIRAVRITRRSYP